MTFAGIHFAPREFQILQFTCAGLTDRETASKMGIAWGTVRNKLKVIRDKTGMDNRVQLAVWYLAHGGDLDRFS